jgi:hypothetical protein
VSSGDALVIPLEMNECVVPVEENRLEHAPLG